ncbi:MAG: hypothetical protein Q4E54_07095 [Lachnospiraceae bacterium]|nr:hypothetical protein [Lachnospiraceae bacterium]
MKKYIALALTLSLILMTGCGKQSETSYPRESETAAETIAQETVTESETTAQETVTEVETIPEEPRYVGTDEEIEEYSGEYYRLVWDNETDPKLYWIKLRKNGSVDFIYETRNTDPRAVYNGTWDVNEHGHVHLNLGKTGGTQATASETLEGNFRFLLNEQDNMNIILITGQDLIESAQGSVQTFQSVRWYSGATRLLSNPDDKNVVTFEVEGENNKWFPVTGMKSDCKFEILEDDGYRSLSLDEFIDRIGDGTFCEFALNQQSLLIKVRIVEQ